MVVCPHFLALDPPVRYRPISTIVDATGVLLGLAFRPSISVLGRWPRCQCVKRVHSLGDILPLPLPPPISNLNNRVISLTHSHTQIPSSVPVPARAENGPPAHPLVVPVVSFALLSAFLSYNTTGAGSLPKVYSACTGLVGIWGLWVVSGFFEWYHR